MFVYECLYPRANTENHSTTMLLLFIHSIDGNQFIEVKGCVITWSKRGRVRCWPLPLKNSIKLKDCISAITRPA